LEFYLETKLTLQLKKLIFNCFVIKVSAFG